MSKFLSSLINRFFRKPIPAVKMSDDDISYSYQLLRRSISGKSGDELEIAITKYLQEVRYPPVSDFKQGLEWFNVSEPLSFEKHLKGKVVVLDFFTYCCINCMHILPDLKEIEEEFSVKDGLVVVGVHSAKFENEKNSSNILSAVQRYNICHPVVNDAEMDMWRKCDVHCWPTLLLLGPMANPIVMLTGEGHKKELKLYIKYVLKYYKSMDLISDHELPLQSAYSLLPDLKGPLLFPGKITSFVTSDKREIFAISDSGNNRILILDDDGLVKYQVGSTQVGLKDDTFDKAQFNNPQGLAFQNEHTLYVADTDNHTIRLIDLKEGVVKTVAGTGVQGNDYKGGKLGQQQSISSPWDLTLYRTKEGKDLLIIAMAGTHQIWALFLEDDTVWWKGVTYKARTCVAIAGSGREENRNNHYPQSAAFAQPSGLAYRKTCDEVYIADSESSSVRRLSLIDGKVTAVLGGDRNPHNLFAFGDKDGNFVDAKLQHPLGLALANDDSVLFVADTYNNKIKKVSLDKNTISTLSVQHEEVDATRGARKSLREPAGLCTSSLKSKLYVADTNNHRIRVIHLNPDGAAGNIEDLQLKFGESVKQPLILKGEALRGKPLLLSGHKKFIIHVLVNLTDGLGLSEDVPQKWEVHLPNNSWSCVPSSGKSLRNLDIVINTPSDINKNEAIILTFDLITCADSCCYPKSFYLELPIEKIEDQTIKESFAKIEVTKKGVHLKN